jgi:PHD/YefM family antitoxin component YafN of YafNO toxin-antitoxin module
MEFPERDMKATRVTASEFQKAFGALGDRALSAPLMITKQGRDHLVVLSAGEYARLKRRDRRVGLAADLPEEWAEAVRVAEVPDQYAHLDSEMK